jgi:hypothetical protein
MLIVTDGQGEPYAVYKPFKLTAAGWVSSGKGTPLAVTPLQWKPYVSRPKKRHVQQIKRDCWPRWASISARIFHVVGFDQRCANVLRQIDRRTVERFGPQRRAVSFSSPCALFGSLVASSPRRRQSENHPSSFQTSERRPSSAASILGPPRFQQNYQDCGIWARPRLWGHRGRT